MIVAFTGPARSGKTTLADYLVRERGFVRVRFAGPLKEMLRAIGVSECEIDGNRKEMPSALLMGRTARHAMQTLGTEWGRNCIGEDFWVGLWQRAAYDIIDHGGRVVVDDLRFANEAETVRYSGGVVIALSRPGAGTSAHASERFAFEPDFRVDNSAALESAFADVDAIVAGIPAA